ncbi:MAG: cupin domain-containing protein [Desulfobacterales bacterium]|nr:cupin domain-containing protein [Desulfobacterales bacterium]
MTEKSVLVNEDQYNWEYEEGKSDRADVIRWKSIISGEKTPTHGMNMGILEVPPGAIMDIHHHHPQEIYYVIRGEAEVYLDNRWQSIKAGDAIYVPKNNLHGVKNSGEELFKLVWMFPTDSWTEIEYH